MTITQTPIFDQLAFEQADAGVNITEIIQRPRWEMPAFSHDGAWNDVVAAHAKLGEAAASPTIRRQRKPRR